jgi:glycosyltransferase involved in cell wall biosynthesis
VAGPEPYKRVAATIKAVARLKSASLLLAGGSAEQEKLGKRLLAERFLRRSFTHQQMPQVYRSSQVFTLASASSEAFGIAYLEALASGLPVVAPDDRLRREILGPHGIYIKDVADIEEYAASLRQALKKTTFCPKEWLKQFSWDVIANQYQKLFQSLCA